LFAVVSVSSSRLQDYWLFPTSYRSQSRHIKYQPASSTRPPAATSMNRYRTVPGLSSQQKATSNTTCQKCLKKDRTSPPHDIHSGFSLTNKSLRHYSYECKATAQERPYVSRPSRTQQLFNPKLAPKLSSDVPNDLLRKYVASIELCSRCAYLRYCLLD
jgi:hypothetical protein